MKRAFYEWSAIGMLALAIACFGYWAVSKVTAAADSAMSFGRLAGDVAISDGTITLADQLNNGEIIEAIEKPLPFVPPLDVIGQYRLSLPGFEFHFITLAGDWPIWRIETSLLIPAGIMSLGAAYSISRYRKLRKVLALSGKRAANNEPVVHPLD